MLRAQHNALPADAPVSGISWCPLEAAAARVSPTKTMSHYTVLWIYIILLLVGGLIGFFKAGSKVSLISSAVAAAALVLTAIHGLFVPAFGSLLADMVMAALLVVFAIRLAKTKKFMPSGLMLVITILALALRHLT